MFEELFKTGYANILFNHNKTGNQHGLPVFKLEFNHL